MAIPSNGYLDDAAVYGFAKLRFPANFQSSVPDSGFVGALYIAGDIINSNNDVWLGEKRTAVAGGKTWPRQLVGGGDAAPFLTAIVPDALLRGYEWLAIAVALSPEDFGTTGTSSTSTVTSNGGLKLAEIGGARAEYFAPTTRTSTSQTDTEVPLHLQFHFDQAKFFLEQLVRPGAQLKLPGLPEQIPLPPAEKGYHTLSDFCVK